MKTVAKRRVFTKRTWRRSSIQ